MPVRRQRASTREPERARSSGPELEAHQKILADVEAGDLAAITTALDAAWRMQRR